MDELTTALASDLDGAFPDWSTRWGPALLGSAPYVRRPPGGRGPDPGDLHQGLPVAPGDFDRRRFAELRLGPWVWTIALNLGRNHLRSRSRRPMFVEMQGTSTGIEIPTCPTTERGTAVLPSLNRNQRTAVVLRHVVGLGIAEISESTGRPEGTVKADIHRGLDEATRDHGARSNDHRTKTASIWPALCRTASAKALPWGPGSPTATTSMSRPWARWRSPSTRTGSPRSTLASQDFGGLLLQAPWAALIRAEAPSAWADRIPGAIEAGHAGKAARRPELGDRLPGQDPADRDHHSQGRGSALRLAGPGGRRAGCGKGRGLDHGPQPDPADHPLPSGGPVRRDHRRLLARRPPREVGAADPRRGRPGSSRRARRAPRPGPGQHVDEDLLQPDLPRGPPLQGGEHGRLQVCRGGDAGPGFGPVSCAGPECNREGPPSQVPSAPMETSQAEQLAVNTIKALAMDAVQKADSGHPGMPMGMADIAVVLWGRYLTGRPRRSGVAGPRPLRPLQRSRFDAPLFAAPPQWVPADPR